MRAAIFETPGLDNLKVVDNAEDPKMKNRDILIKIKTAGVNPIDNLVVSGMLPRILPFPHIPGAESSGIVEQIGSHVSNDNIKVGDRVVVHNKVFDGTCDMCLNGLDMICRNGGLIGAITNGGFAEYISVPERNVFKIPNDLNWDIAASLPVSSLTPYHALNEASVKLNEFLLVFGASGSTGMVAVQLGKKMGAKVIAVSRNDWIKTEFGADYVINDYDKVVDQVKEITQGKMAEVVMNSLGIGTWESSVESVGINGRLVTFGGLTGADVKLNVQSLYRKQIKIIGSTGGTRKELQDLITIASKEGLKIKVWKKFKLDEVKEALQALFAKERDGRILLDIT
ncbi:MAG: alcohol dehydrogenase catalytic domain-containing protein [Nitrososphaeraceae archaeon]